MQTPGTRPPYTGPAGGGALVRDAEGEKVTRRRRGTAVKRAGFGMPNCTQRRHCGHEGQSWWVLINLLLLAA
jgi:hypothetical protein